MLYKPPIAVKATRSVTLKSVALTLILCLLFQEFSNANPELLRTDYGLSTKDISWAKKTLPEIPESVASIEDAWKAPQGSGSSSAVILVQDAHTNSSCQLNESRLFDLLFQNKISNQVFTEAAKGNVNLTFLRNEAALSQRKVIAGEYLQKGLLHGIEYLDLTSNHVFKVEGVEDPSLYFESLKVYRQSAKKRDDFERYLQAIDSTIQTLIPKLMNPFLLSFLETKNRQKETPADYLETLISKAGFLKIDLEAYPNLKKLKELKALEAKIDFKAANAQQQEAVQSLSMDDRQELSQVSASKLSFKDSQRGVFLFLKES